MTGLIPSTAGKKGSYRRYLKLFPSIFFLVSCGRSPDVVHPVHKDIIETVYASGKIIPENEYHVYALSSGTVRQKLVKEGDTVSTGTVIYKISNDAPVARLEAARSAYENTRENLSEGSGVLNELRLGVNNAAAKFTNDSLTYFRMKNLYDQNAASKSALDNAFTAYTVSQNQKKSAEEQYNSTRNELNVALQNAKSQLTGAATDLDNYFIRSESSGTVFQLLKEEGEAVHAGEIVALVGETTARVIRLAVDQQDIDKIKTGQQVLLKTDVTGNTIFHAEISRIYPVMNEIDQTFRVDAVFRDSISQAYVHSSVEANIIIQEKKNAFIIPRSALVSDDSVQVKTEGKKKNVFVSTGIRTLDDVEILNGLDESSEVILPVQK